MKTTPTRNFAEYAWTLKEFHGFKPGVCLEVRATGGSSAEVMGAFPDARHVCAVLDADAPEGAPAAAAEEEDHEGFDRSLYRLALLESPGWLPPADGKVNLSSARISTAKRPATGSIKVSTIDHLMEEIGGVGPVVLRLEYRGADLRALRGAVQTLALADVVFVKAGLFRYWGSAYADFADVVAFMKDHGFVVHDILNGAFRKHDRALGVVDLAFVPEAGPFRQKQHW